MREELFRKKSLDKIRSPESLNDYIRVSNPGVWLLLAAIAVLLAGVCVWGIFGHIDSTAEATVRVENGTAFCFVAAEDISRVEDGMTVKLGGWEGILGKTAEKTDEGYACTLALDPLPDDGSYPAQIVIERIHPVSLILD